MNQKNLKHDSREKKSPNHAYVKIFDWFALQIPLRDVRSKSRILFITPVSGDCQFDITSRNRICKPKQSIIINTDVLYVIWSSKVRLTEDKGTHPAFFPEVWELLYTGSTTGGPSSSCEMIILRNNSNSEIMRVCMGIFTIALRNKKMHQILIKNTSPYFHSVSIVIWQLTLTKRTHFR